MEWHLWNEAHKQPSQLLLNPSWKLAMVCNHGVDPEILDTYEQERWPVGQRNTDWSLFTFENSAVINAAFGLVAGDKENNGMRFEKVFADRLTGRSIHAQVEKMVESQCIEFGAHGIELGFVYEEGVEISDGSDAPPVDPLGHEYYQTTRPGHRLPHAWLGSFKDARSTHDLIGLITDKHGASWVEASKRLVDRHGIPIHAVQIGQEAKWKDRDERWEQVKGIKTGGAILVCPDDFVAWRTRGPTTQGGRELEVAFESLLGFNKHIVTDP